VHQADFQQKNGRREGSSRVNVASNYSPKPIRKFNIGAVEMPSFGRPAMMMFLGLKCDVIGLHSMQSIYAGAIQRNWIAADVIK
jgi:hypothetical protein